MRDSMDSTSLKKQNLPCKLVVNHKVKYYVVIDIHNKLNAKMYHMDWKYANIFQLFFVEDVTTVTEEYLAFDVFSLVGEMGGALGLFLGWSCLNILLDLLGFLTGRCLEMAGGKKKSSRQRSMMSKKVKEERIFNPKEKP